MPAAPNDTPTIETRTPVGAPGAPRTPPAAGRPAAVTHTPPPPATPRKSGVRRALPWIVLAVIALFAARAGMRLWQQRQTRIPDGIAYGNGRLEPDEIDLATKFPGRIAELFVNEGDMVRQGQAVARMDVRDMEAQRRTARSQVEQARGNVREDEAAVAQQRTQVELARKELDRYRALREHDFVTQDEVDQRQQTYDAGVAALAAARERVAAAQQALDATLHVVELSDVNIADNTLRAPRDGRIEYRIANVGEVVPAGGKVFTMLDATSVYMDIYLPTVQAGRVRVGSEARIVLDAYPNDPLPAFVSFLAGEAQFTPKAVETQSERDNLMFRVRVRLDPRLLRTHEEAVRSGLPGVAYVRIDSTVAWPPALQPRPARAPSGPP